MSHGAASARPALRRATAEGNLLVVLLVGAVRAYQVVVAPWLGPCCRFHPSCSNYALDAFVTHGAVRGAWLTARRLIRCQPFSAGGIDPVPPGSECRSQEATARG